MEELLVPQQIDSAQEQLDRELKEALPDIGPHKLGYRGGAHTLKLRSAGRHRLYYASVFIDRDDTAKRYWNAFGFYDGNSHGAQRIAVEINIPNPPSRQVAGFFARDLSSNRISLLHDGKIGGGKEGVTRSAFIDHSGLRPVIVNPKLGREAIVIATLGDADLVVEIEKFVRAVASFKNSLD